MKWIFLLVGFLIPPGAFGGEPRLQLVQVECDSPGDLLPQVKACTENEILVERARDCYENLLKAWRAAPKDLNKNYAFNKKIQTRKQEESLSDAQRDYQRSMDKLENLIQVTDRNTDLISRYPLAMREDPETEVDCYTSAFGKIQKIVDELEDRIDEGLLALGAADARRGISKARDERVDSLNTSLIKGREAATPVRDSKTPRNRDSDVTGIKEEQSLNGNASSSTSGYIKGLDIKKMKSESDSEWVDSFLENRSK